MHQHNLAKHRTRPFTTERVDKPQHAMTLFGMTRTPQVHTPEALGEANSKTARDSTRFRSAGFSSNDVPSMQAALS